MEELLDEEVVNLPEDPTPAVYAGFWVRVVAAIIDVLVMIPIIVLVFYNLSTFRSYELMFGVAIAQLVYKPFLEFYYGATVGKMALGIKVVDKHRQRIGLDKAILRNLPLQSAQLINLIVGLLYFFTQTIEPDGELNYYLNSGDFIPFNLDGIATLLVLACGISVAFNRRKQGFHDRWAGTLVVQG